MKTLIRVCAVLGAVASAACAGPPYPTGSMAELFPQGPQPIDQAYSIDGHRIHYVEQPGGPARVLFLHGTPGDWQAWAGFLADPRLRARATMIAVDRPGFGESDPGRVVPMLDEQSKLLRPLLDGPGAPTILVGHSLGGPLAGQIAMDYPAHVRAALLIAPAIDPATERPRWYNYAMTWRISEWLLPREFAWSNREIMPLRAEVAAMAGGWARLPMPLTVLQGMKDGLVDPATADFAARRLPPQTQVLRVPDLGHLLLWQQPQLVVDALLALIDRSAPPPATTGAAS